MGNWRLSLRSGERGTGTGTELWRGGGIITGDREVAAGSPVGGEEDEATSAGTDWVLAGEVGWVPGVTNPTWRTIGLLGARFGRRGSIGEG